MKQLSRRRRRFYFLTLALIFVVVIPLLILYSMGYRLSDARSLISTGGIYVHSNVGDMEVKVNGNVIKTTGIFQKNAFIDNLRPGTYTVALTKDGYRPWKRTVPVEANRVVELHSLVVPLVFTLTPVPASLTATSTLTPAAIKKLKTKDLNPAYVEAQKLFNATTTIATSSLPVPTASTTQYIALDGLRVNRNLLAWLDNGHIVTEWHGADDATPYYFCKGDTCAQQKTLALPDPIRSFDFYPGRDDAVIIAGDDSLRLAELDTRTTPNTYNIVQGKNLSFRIGSGGIVYIKDADNLIYSLVLE